MVARFALRMASFRMKVSEEREMSSWLHSTSTISSKFSSQQGSCRLSGVTTSARPSKEWLYSLCGSSSTTWPKGGPEERRVGKEGVSRCRSRWSLNLYKTQKSKKKQQS